ncbi:MAG: polyphosphate polymerase domain-containing protein, partial [Lachnospiraceae bacterium]|nr:polyphosphate polymerase domain-containing protein [Lachnospiraceae bacterium]
FGLLEQDSHVREDGTYVVRSLYFDDYEDTCLFENESGTDCRTKFRIRYYNDDSSRIQLEKKSKYRGMTQKEACLLEEEEYRSLILGHMPQLSEGMPKQKKELLLEMQLRNLLPKVIVTYERVPFIYPTGNVRVTFDRNISSSFDTEHFLTGVYGERPIFPPGRSILEVKWDELLPLHVKEAMEMELLEWTAFSKYYMCRRYHL